jgi:hypothetical protein
VRKFRSDIRPAGDARIFRPLSSRYGGLVETVINGIPKGPVERDFCSG